MDWKHLFVAYMLCWGGDSTNHSHTISIVDYHFFPENARSLDGLRIVIARQWLHLLFRYFQRYTRLKSRKIDMIELVTELTKVSVNDEIGTATMQRWSALFPPAPRQKRQLLVLKFQTVLEWMQQAEDGLLESSAESFVAEPEGDDTVTENVILDIAKVLQAVPPTQKKTVTATDEWLNLAWQRHFWSRPSSLERCSRAAFCMAQQVVNQQVFGRDEQVTQPMHTAAFWKRSSKAFCKRPKRNRSEPAVDDPDQRISEKSRSTKRLHLDEPAVRVEACRFFAPPISGKRKPILPFHPLSLLPKFQAL